MYYVEAKPEISDLEFDRLLARAGRPGGGPSRTGHAGQPHAARSAASRSRDFETVTHRVPMLSIDKCNSAEDLRDFDNRVRKTARARRAGQVRRRAEDRRRRHLADLRERLFTLGATRGDGEHGDDVTQNLKTVGGVPLRLQSDKPPGLFEARGEVYMSRADFVAPQRGAQGQGRRALRRTRATSPPARSSCSIRKTVPNASCGCSPTRVGGHRAASKVKTHLEVARPAAAVRLPRQPAHQGVRQHRRGDRVRAELGRRAARARLRHRRHGHQGQRSSASSERLGRHVEGAALGDGVQVRDGAGHHTHPQHRAAASARTAC